MRKLKLDAVKVESFETTRPVSPKRGTLYAHQSVVPLETYDIEACGDTHYMDCTYGCSWDTGCPDACFGV